MTVWVMQSSAFIPTVLVFCMEMEQVWRKLQGHCPGAGEATAAPPFTCICIDVKWRGGGWGGACGTSPAFDKWDWAAPLGAIVRAVAMAEGAGRTMRMSEVEINGGSFFSEVWGRLRSSTKNTGC